MEKRPDEVLWDNLMSMSIGQLKLFGERCVQECVLKDGRKVIDLIRKENGNEKEIQESYHVSKALNRADKYKLTEIAIRATIWGAVQSLLKIDKTLIETQNEIAKDIILNTL